MKTTKKFIYCDMDGVIADFYSADGWRNRFETEKGFFANLQPIQGHLDGIKALIELGYSVRILSASPNKQADKDKRRRIKKYLPELPMRRVIIMRNGQNKSDFAKTKKGILLDDYGVNCKQWADGGRTAIKIYPHTSILATVLNANVDGSEGKVLQG